MTNYLTRYNIELRHISGGTVWTAVKHPEGEFYSVREADATTSAESEVTRKLFADILLFFHDCSDSIRCIDRVVDLEERIEDALAARPVAQADAGGAVVSADPNPFNKLTPAEAERLALLIEECGEVVQAACKVLRHGYESCPPRSSETNREALARELGDLQAARELMLKAKDVHRRAITEAYDDKLQRVSKYLHHQGKS